MKTINRNTTLLTAAGALLLLSTTANAQDGVGMEPSPAGTSSEASSEAAVVEESSGPSIAFSGFVEAGALSTAYFGDNAPNADELRFGLDQAELNLDVQATDSLSMRFDLQFAPQAFGDGTVSMDDILEQGYFEFNPNGDGTGFFMRAGKYNAPIGAEMVDAPDRLQDSLGLLFSFAAPTNVSGLVLGYNAGDITAQLQLVNDWDVVYDPGDLSLLGRLDYALPEGGIGLAIMYSSLFEDGLGSNYGHFLADVDFNYAFGDLLLIAELTLNALTGDYEDDIDTLGYGALVKVNYAFNDVASLTARVSYLNRFENLGASAVALGDPWFGSYHGVEGTLAGLFNISDNYRALVELRVDRFLGDLDDDLVRFTPSVELLATF